MKTAHKGMKRPASRGMGAQISGGRRRGAIDAIVDHAQTGRRRPDEVRESDIVRR